MAVMLVSTTAETPRRQACLLTEDLGSQAADLPGTDVLWPSSQPWPHIPDPACSARLSPPKALAHVLLGQVLPSSPSSQEPQPLRGSGDSRSPEAPSGNHGGVAGVKRKETL